MAVAEFKHRQNMKLPFRLSLIFLGSTSCFFFAYATNMRFPKQLGRESLVEAAVITTLLSTLCLLVKKPRDFAFSTGIVVSLVLHQCFWGVDRLTDYWKVGTDAWAGDGFGALLTWITELPIFLLLLIGTITAVVLAVRERLKGKEAESATAAQRP